MQEPTRLMNILLIEDNPGDVRLTQEAFKEGNINVNLMVAIDGVEALKVIEKKDPYADAETPDIILLDLNLPRKDGREVLEFVKTSEKYRRIPVIVLTTSNAVSDIQNSYYAHANCYINKPVDFNRFFDVIRRIESFWLDTVILPTTIR